jgi:hypothetical protein
MALQTSGAISLLDIAGEFGGSAPHSLSEYYGVATGVPSSGAIDLSDFYGTSSIITWVQTMSFTNTPYDPGSGKIPIATGGFTSGGSATSPSTPISIGFYLSLGHDTAVYLSSNRIKASFYNAINGASPLDKLIRIYIPDVGWLYASSSDQVVVNDQYSNYRSYNWSHNSNSSAEAGGNKTITMEFNP